ncbi:MAG: sugar isomerase, partial [Christensenellaceae bacterium]|nr:sugar isomerase [Christensenellaceae bacterium]
SGQVARIGEAINRCKKAGAFTLGITGNRESVLGTSAERILKLDIPKFESAPGTRTYMVCVMALYLLAIRIGEVRGRYTMDVATSMREEIPLLADKLEEMMPSIDDKAYEIANKFKDKDAFDFLGSGFEYAAAWFSAAKVFEAIGARAMHTNTEEWLHLNFFMKNPEKIATMIYSASDNKAYSRTVEAINYAVQLNRPLCVVADEKSEDYNEKADLIIIPKAKYILAEAMYQFVPVCLIMGYLMSMLGEKSGRGNEGPWEFSRGAACVRQSKIIYIDEE